MAFVSSDMSGFFNEKFEPVSAPRTIALWVYDLDGGAVTVPFAVDDFTTRAVEPPPWNRYG